MTAAPHQDGHQFLDAVRKALEFGGSLGKMRPTDAVNVAAEHVHHLLDDAMACFRRGSFGTAVFLAITALEETAKADLIGHYGRADRAQPTGKDPMRSHKQKHLLGVRPTTFMGRLPSILGDAACARLQREAETGGLVTLREQALYVHFEKDGLVAPATAVGFERARELLLLATESADDVLVGLTNHSYELGRDFEAWLSELAAAGEGPR